MSMDHITLDTHVDYGWHGWDWSDSYCGSVTTWGGPLRLLPDPRLPMDGYEDEFVDVLSVYSGCLVGHGSSWRSIYNYDALLHHKNTLLANE